ncbi:hypothetical protein AURDEDRAFT_160834 [Auricularia subglabra TFB-10046 SS5]|nr:hypothetical protein AURDEDRAFT_160834 [Auricularia subglabra TFB-10046 SS5]
MASISPEDALMGQSSIERIPEEMRHLAAFRPLAQLAGLYVKRTVIWNDIKGFDASLATLNDLIDHATSDNPEINLAIDAIFEVHEPSSTTPSVVAQALGVVFDAVQRAMSYLVSLKLLLPDPMADDAYSPLCTHPAPKLRSLDIHWRQCFERSAPIPQNLFAGEAPLLRRLSLSLIDTGPTSIWHPVKVFRGVTQLSFSTHGTGHEIPLSHLFPCVTDLKVSPVLWLSSPKIDISGLKLHWLKLNGGPELLADPDSRALIDIPIVEATADGTAVALPDTCGELCARIQHLVGGVEHVALSFAPPSGAWRRTVCVMLRNLDEPVPLAPARAERLTSLTLDVSLVNSLALTLLVLPALRELLLDVSAGCRVWPPAPPTHSVSFPALAWLVFFSIAGDDETVIVEAAKVIELARALGLRGTRPTLTLAGCAFTERPDMHALHCSFSAVDFMDRARDALPAYYETCRYTEGFYGNADA